MNKVINKEKFKNILTDIKERDKKDAKIDETNRKILEDAGFSEYKSKKTIKVDTGKIIGVRNVVLFIKEKIAETHKIITITGLSGTGKSATADRLKKEIGAIKFSMGEIFRYLTYLRLKNDKDNFQEIIKNLHYQTENENINLVDGKINVSKKLSKELRSSVVERGVPETASKTQEIVLRFVSEEIFNIRAKTDKKIILEGRGFTLDFIPSDLRIILFADSKIRAARRVDQYDKR